MGTAKIFNNGKSQAVRLPKECRFEGNEVGIKKVGNMVLLYPIENALEAFLQSPPASDDFGDDVLEARRSARHQERDPL